jgi:Xaa-Pro dipeptidase
MRDLLEFQKAIREEALDGWLFCNFHHRDTIADRLLSIPPEAMNTRFWFYFLPTSGEPRKVVHAIESSILDRVPGTRRVYSSRDELIQILKTLPHGRFGCSVSETLPVFSFLDEGTAALLRSCGFALASAGSLIQRLASLLDREGMRSHEEAAAKLRTVVEETWKFVRTRYTDGKSLTEGELVHRMEEAFDRSGLTSGERPLAAVGKNSADPHYAVSGEGETVSPGDIIQLDLWAKNRAPAAVYADISWVGVYGERPEKRVAETFAYLARARDGAVAFIAERLAEGSPPQGREVDETVRRFLFEGGFGLYLKHRTGHGIDEEVHGFGVNLDAVEFPDDRRLLEGSCFSVEPGLYFPDYGLRTEIDVYIRGGKPVISGGKPQRRILTCRSGI